jgi:glucose-6-phosphate 1-dehydrogenase
MSELDCDALVFFGATGDLAYKKIFPALQAMVKRGTLNVPVIGIAKSGWQGVPFFIRSGKLLEATCTEIVARLRRPPSVFPTMQTPNYLRFRINPVNEVAIGLNVMDAEERGDGQTVELLANRVPGVNDRDAYERVLSDALAGDPTLFAREDYVEEAWRIVDPVVKLGTPLYPYESGTWGPKEVESVAPPGGWQNPVIPGV